MRQKTKPREKRRRPKGTASRNLGVVPAAVIDSDAFASLNGCETKMLLGFYRRRKWSRKEKSYTNEDHMVYTLDCMSYEAGVSRRQAIDARNALLEVGFVDLCLESDGTLGRPCVYALSDRFLLWHPDADTRSRQGYRTHPLGLPQLSGRFRFWV